MHILLLLLLALPWRQPSPQYDPITLVIVTESNRQLVDANWNPVATNGYAVSDMHVEVFSRNGGHHEYDSRKVTGGISHEGMNWMGTDFNGSYGRVQELR